jgi:lipase maturation factor 1
MPPKTAREFLTSLSLTLSRVWFRGFAGEEYSFSSWLFLRLLALLYFAQFYSLLPQLPGLIGSGGILPVAETLHLAKQRDSILALLKMPTLFWYGANDVMVQGVAWLGLIFSLLLFAGLLPGICALGLYLCFVSFASVAGDFFSFSGDRLFLEAGFLAIFVAPFRFISPFRKTPDPPKLARFLFLWLLFRVHFQPAYFDLTRATEFPEALSFGALFHQNQLIPSRFGWSLHQIPPIFHWLLGSLILGIRLFLPFFVFAGLPRFRYFAAGSLALLSLLCWLTAFPASFGLLSFALVLFAFDDIFWSRLLAGLKLKIGELAGNRYRGISAWWRRALLIPYGLATIIFLFGFGTVKFPFAYRYSNEFARTEWRPEIQIQGTADGTHWENYSFKFKPETPDRLAAHFYISQPRLDSVIARAAAEDPSSSEWTARFCKTLLERSSSVLGLLEKNPFPYGNAIRIRFVRYWHRFTDAADRAEGWWIPQVTKTHPSIIIFQQCARD